MAFDSSGIIKGNTQERAKTWEKRGNELFSVQERHCQFWQAQCEIFYPERADFISQTPEAEERYDNIFTGMPQLMRRDMANNLGAMLRPRGEDWMKAVARPARLMKLEDVRQWCEDATETQRNFIYSPAANFPRAMAESDNDYVAIGNSVVALTDNRDRTGLLFTCLHPRDCAWAENDMGVVDELHRKINLTLQQAVRMFKLENLPDEWQKRYAQNAHDKVVVRQCVAPIDVYSYASGERPLGKFKYASIYIAVGAKEPFLAEGFFSAFPFLVRRWMTVSGEAYGRSPCSGVSLADSRTLNIAEASLLKNIEWQTDPPKMAKDEAVIGDIRLQSGAVTFVSTDTDYRAGRPIENVEVGEPRFAMEYVAGKARVLGLAFFQNVLKLPDRELTAYEARERLKLLVREAAPIIEPMEAENARLMDASFERIMGHNGFQEPPEALQGAEVVFEFETPLTSARKELKAVNVAQKTEQLTLMAQVQPDVVDNVNFDAMTKDLLADSPVEWINKPEVVEQIREAKAQAQQAKDQAALALEVGKTALNAKPENIRMAEEAYANQ